MKKAGRILSTVLVLILIMMQFTYVSQAASVRNKKVVAVVYDDSGSMMGATNKSWVYANYAMQSFVGLLNKEDVLYLRYMNNQNVRNIDTQNKDKWVADIRDYFILDGGTPFSAVDSAYETLAKHQDANPNTQYWLFVMTDGGFNDKKLPEVETELAKYADSKMPNGTKPKIVFLAIGDTTDKFTPSANIRSNITVKGADAALDITTAISDIASEISGRYSVDASDIKVLDEHTLEVSSELPLLSIGVLSQYSVATVTKAEVSSEHELTIESNVGIKHPDSQPGYETDTSLIGNVAMINNGNSNIPAGTYRITFSEAIEAKDVNIMFEPALELRLIILSEGNEITDLSKIPTGAELTAKATLYEMGTDNEIDLSLLPSGVTHSIIHSENGNEIASTNEMIMDDIMISTEKTRIDATLDLPGYFNLNVFYEFTPVNIQISDITAELYYDGSERKGNDGNDVVYISDLKKNKTGVKFTVYSDGEPLDKEEVELILSSFKSGIDTKLTPYGVEVDDEGKILVYPTETVFINDLFYWICHRGQQSIGVELDGFTASEEVFIKGSIWIPIDLWILIFLIQCLILKLFRKTFHKEKIQTRSGSTGRNRNDPFSGIELSALKTLYSRTRPALETLLYLIVPIVFIPLLLRPAELNLGNGLKLLATHNNFFDGRKGFKLVGVKEKPVLNQEYRGIYTLPGAGNIMDENEIEMFPQSAAVIALSANNYFEIRVY